MSRCSLRCRPLRPRTFRPAPGSGWPSVPTRCSSREKRRPRPGLDLATPVLTTERRLGAGPILRAGSRASYRSVVDEPGEAHLVRADLVGEPPDGEVKARGPAMACIGHITDLHVTDVQSPARFEFVNREWEDPRFRELLTMQRPHETLNVRAVEALLRALGRIERAPMTGNPIELVAMTGDSIDNTQLNELTNFLALMDGGIVHPDSGAPGYDGVQAIGWPSEIFCTPS